VIQIVQFTILFAYIIKDHRRSFCNMIGLHNGQLKSDLKIGKC